MNEENGVRFLLGDHNEAKNLVYRPPNSSEPKVQKATLGVKFSDDIFLLESFLKKRKIPYKQSDLEDSPFGRGIRIKRNNKEMENKNETS
ncbi:MAG TPA: hypothetical protein VMR37_03570 [Rhabdochlamydiaceae bacterium]|jgi:hypothetical protein|nr:hypothetical protein [Rhabdochlamydiaceae bacterium]